MSDTPRTDANIEKVYRGAEVTRYVRADFARQLEREIAEAKDKSTDLRYLNEALTRKLAYYERHSGRLCQDGQPCKKPGECEARGKCSVFKGTPMEGLTSKPDSEAAFDEWMASG